MQLGFSTADDPRALLRRATLAQHERLHRHPFLRPILSRRVTVRQYLEVLEAYYGIYRPLEERVCALVQDVSSGRLGHAERLACDLAYFGHTHRTLGHLRLCTDLPELSSIAALLGCMYVIEGSMLGGRGIARHVTQTLGLTEQSGCRFFSAYGIETHALWAQFCAQMHTRLRGRRARAIAVRAAVASFAAFQRWFDTVASSDSTVLPKRAPIPLEIPHARA